jgi:hypothetical protein
VGAEGVFFLDLAVLLAAMVALLLIAARLVV